MKKQTKYYVVNIDSSDGHYIETATTDARYAHRVARNKTFEEKERHIVLKPVAEYSVEIKKKRFN